MSRYPHRQRATVLPSAGAGFLLLLLACNSSTTLPLEGSGGATPASGGAMGTGGRVGAFGTGGLGATGGLTASGGFGPTDTGGASAATGGSAAATGGRPGTGGGPSASSGGGTPGSGGRASTGGVSPESGGNGGNTATTSTGGAAGGAAQPFKGVAGPACADIGRLTASWWYNWTTAPGSCATPDFVPMISGKNEKTTAAVTTALGRVAAAGYRTVLGFNEPNKPDQSNLTVAQVLELWPALTANAAIRVGSPATSADAQTWFTDFMTQASARNLRVDFIALHWYGWNAGSCDSKAAGLENYIKWAEAIPGNRPLWITEWGCLNQSNPDPATVQAFYQGAVAMFARHPRIERYAWYPATANNELVVAGALTPLGTSFASAPSQH